MCLVASLRRFSGCTALTQLPPRLFRNCLEATHFGGAFSGCTQLLSVPDEFFKDLPWLTILERFFRLFFTGKSGKSCVFWLCACANIFLRFYYCRVLEEVGDDILRVCQCNYLCQRLQ
jgi:hypothetical protein